MTAPRAKLINPKGWLLFSTEIRQFFVHRRSLHFVPLLVGGVVLTAWVYPAGSPFLPIVIVVLIGLEPQFNNIFYRTPNELEALIMFPTSWKRVVMMKNLAAVALTLICFILTSMALLYFSPEIVTFRLTSDAILYLLTIMFPLTQLGNTRSIQHPRRNAGWQIDDFIEAVWMLATIGVLSIPYFLLTGLIEAPVLVITYGVATMVVWYKVSLSKIAANLEKEKEWICMNA